MIIYAQCIIVYAVPTIKPIPLPPRQVESTPKPTPIPTPTPVPALLEFNNSMVEEFKANDVPIDIDVMKKNDVLKYFNVSVRIGGTFVVLAVVFSIVAMFFSGDFYTTAKLKIIVRDFIFSAFMLGTMYWWLGWAFTGSNLFYLLWDTGNGFSIAGIISSAGIGVVAAIVNPALLIWVAVALALAFLYQVLMTSLIYLLQAVVILLPLFQALYPLKFFKGIYKSTLGLVFTILAIFPMQNLFILLAKTTLLNNTLSMQSISSLLGLLIIIVVVIPGVAMAGFMKIFQGMSSSN